MDSLCDKSNNNDSNNKMMMKDGSELLVNDHMFPKLNLPLLW